MFCLRATLAVLVAILAVLVKMLAVLVETVAASSVSSYAAPETSV